MEAARAVAGGALLAALALAACTNTKDSTGSDSAKNGAEGAGAPTPEVAAAMEQGHELFFGKAKCSTCHRVGDEGTMIVGPNLGVGDDMDAAFAARVGTRGPNIDPPTYVIDSILDPNAIVVPSYARGVMKSPDDIPIALSDDELVALAAFIMSVGAVEPVEPAALERARAHIPRARAAREAGRKPANK